MEENNNNKNIIWLDFNEDGLLITIWYEHNNELQKYLITHME